MSYLIEETRPSIAPVTKLERDALAAIESGTTSNEARVLVDMFYGMQEFRKRLANQTGAMDSGADEAPQHEALDFMLTQVEVMEDNAFGFLRKFATQHPVWPWLEAVHGIGPTLAAGLIAHLGSREPPATVGSWWRFAGLDPSQKWLSQADCAKLYDQATGSTVTDKLHHCALVIGRDPATVLRDATANKKDPDKPHALTKQRVTASLARIPFNRPLRTLTWKCSAQWTKLGDKPEYFYAHWYRKRKALEELRNERGDRKQLAEKKLKECPNHAQKAIYAQGKLPPGRVDLMAKRATAKLFLSHLHEIWYKQYHGEKPPAPFSTSIQGHAHYIPPPYPDAIAVVLGR